MSRFRTAPVGLSDFLEGRSYGPRGDVPSRGQERRSRISREERLLLNLRAWRRRVSGDDRREASFERFHALKLGARKALQIRCPECEGVMGLYWEDRTSLPDDLEGTDAAWWVDMPYEGQRCEAAETDGLSAEVYPVSGVCPRCNSAYGAIELVLRVGHRGDDLLARLRRAWRSRAWRVVYRELEFRWPRGMLVDRRATGSPERRTDRVAVLLPKRGAVGVFSLEDDKIVCVTLGPFGLGDGSGFDVWKDAGGVASELARDVERLARRIAS